MHDEMPSAPLLLPRAGSGDHRTLLRKLRLLALRRLLTESSVALAPPLGPALARLQAVLARCARRAPEVLLDAIGRVDVLVPLLCLEGRTLPASAMLPDAVPTLLLALSRGGSPFFDEAVLWDVPIPRVVDMERRYCLRCDPPAHGLHVDPLGAELRLASGALVRFDDSSALANAGHGMSVARPFQPLSNGAAVFLSELDSNPLSRLEAHPDKRGNAVDLGGREPSEWVARLGEAMDVVGVALPVLREEIEGSLQRVVPVGYEPERHLSASYREAPGLVYLTLHPNALTLAEAIVHETQHGKLNALSWLDPVLVNGHSEWTTSPVRPDLRPLMGVLLAAHAFVPVAALHRRLAALDHPLARTPEFLARRAEVLESNRDSLATVTRLAQPTTLGRRLIEDLARLHEWSAATTQ